MIEYQMPHLNNNMMCAISIRTSGPNPLKHDILQICIAVVDNFINISDKYMPFTIDLKPKRIDSIENYKEAEVTKAKLFEICNVTGIDPYLAADRFEEWFLGLGLRGQKRIVPLCYNWSKIKPFMLKWLEYETCTQLIADQVRDLLVLAVAANDKANIKQRPYPFAKPIFSYLCSSLGVRLRSKDVTGDCVALCDAYKAMIATEPNFIGGSW